MEAPGPTAIAPAGQGSTATPGIAAAAVSATQRIDTPTRYDVTSSRITTPDGVTPSQQSHSPSARPRAAQDRCRSNDLRLRYRSFVNQTGLHVAASALFALEAASAPSRLLP